jgi:endoglucanase
MTNGSPDYKLDPLFLEFLDNAVNWAEELKIYLILDNHSANDIASRNPQLESILVKVWKQMARHYKNRSKYILYEILNEPNGITTQEWGRIQQLAIDAIRGVDNFHTIIVGPSNWNSIYDLDLLPKYSDTKLIYTFHFYDPFIFTHQGASWPVPSLSNLAGVPFPSSANNMPSLPKDLKGTQIETDYNNYKVDGTVENLKKVIDIVNAFKNKRNVNVFCGEFGVYKPNCKDTDRVYWYEVVRKYFEKNSIAWTTWDYQDGFGLFKLGSNEMFNYDLNLPLIHALGLKEPPQKVYEMKADSAGFSIYQDMIGENIYESSFVAGGTLDYYSEQKPNNDKYCISLTGCKLDAAIGFDFLPVKDLSKLVNENYALSFMVRGNYPGSIFDVRFLDTKTSDPNDHPWRMNYTIDKNIVPWDSKWHKVYIPLKKFIDQGSWDNDKWYNSIGAFDWKAVDRFEIVTKQGAETNKYFWFDNITITNKDTAQIFDNSTFILQRIK